MAEKDTDIQLVVRGEEDRVFELSKGINIIGRERTSKFNVVIDRPQLAPEQLIILVASDGLCTLVPLETSNGTMLQLATTLRQLEPHQSYLIKPDQVFSIDGCELLVRLPKNASEPMARWQDTQTMPIGYDPTVPLIQTRFKQPSTTIPLNLDLPTQDATPTATIPLAGGGVTQGVTVPIPRNDTDEEEASITDAENTGAEMKEEEEPISATEAATVPLDEEDADEGRKGIVTEALPTTMPVTQVYHEGMDDEERLVTQMEEVDDRHPDEVKTTQSEKEEQHGAAEDEEEVDRSSVASDDILLDGARNPASQPDQTPVAEPWPELRKAPTPPPVELVRRTGPRSTKRIAELDQTEHVESAPTLRSPSPAVGLRDKASTTTIGTPDENSSITERPLPSTTQKTPSSPMPFILRTVEGTPLPPNTSTAAEETVSVVKVPEAEVARPDIVAKISTMTVAELKDEMKQLGLDFRGKKDELISRLAAYLAATTPLEAPAAASQRALEAASLLDAMKKSDGESSSGGPDEEGEAELGDEETDEAFAEVMKAKGLRGARHVSPPQEPHRPVIQQISVRKADSRPLPGDEANEQDEDENSYVTAKPRKKSSKNEPHAIPEILKPLAGRKRKQKANNEVSLAEVKTPFAPAIRESVEEKEGRTQEEKAETERTAASGSKKKKSKVISDDETDSAVKDTKRTAGSKKGKKTTSPNKGENPAEDQGEMAAEEPLVKSHASLRKRPGDFEEEMESATKGLKRGRQASPPKERDEAKSSTATKRASMSPIASSAVTLPSPTQIRIMFTNIDPTEAHLAAVKRLGGEVVDSARTNADYRWLTHLVVLKGSMKRTLKLLHVMAVAGPNAPRVVHVEWLMESAKEGRVLPADAFVPFEGAQSMKHALKLREKDATKGMLEGLTVLIADKSIQPSFSELAPIVEQAGGDPKIATTEAIKQCPIKSSVVIGSEESLTKAMKDAIAKRKITFCKPSWITQSIASYSMKTSDEDKGDSIISKGSLFI